MQRSDWDMTIIGLLIAGAITGAVVGVDQAWTATQICMAMIVVRTMPRPAYVALAGESSGIQIGGASNVKLRGNRWGNRYDSAR